MTVWSGGPTAYEPKFFLHTDAIRQPCAGKSLSPILVETRQQIVFSFGSKVHEIIDYCVLRLEEYYRDTGGVVSGAEK
jgi:hypothetical protein